MAWLAAVLGVVAGVVITIVATRSSSRVREDDTAARLADELRTSASGVRVELDRLRAALDVLPVGIVVADARGEVVVRNRPATRFTGSWQGDVLVDEAAQLMLRATLTGEAGERTLDLFGPPRRVVVLRAVPINGGVDGGLVIIDDITERVRTDAVRTDFVTNISHELKTPVGALTVLAETLVDADDPNDVRRLSDKVVREADRLSRTIDDLLELSRIELGGAAVSDPVAVQPVLEGAVQRISAAAEQRSISVRIVGSMPETKVAGDRRQLMSALGNLVENAVKYSEKGGRVEVSAELADDHVAFVVADHGIGIPAGDLDRIFERFYRVDRARSRETGGTGLGLSIVRHVATNHGGSVSVESIEGEGSTFRLCIPIAAVATSAPIEHQEPFAS